MVQDLPAVLGPKTPEEQLAERREKFQEGVRRAVEIYNTERGHGGLVFPRFPMEPYVPPKGVVPSEQIQHVLAMDASWKNLAEDANFSSMLSTMNGITANVLDGMGFPGFPFLTELTQLTEYRDMSERTAAEMTRKWIKLRSTGDDDKQDIIDIIDRELKRHRIRDLFRTAAVLDGFMGRCMLFANFGDVVGQELETPLLLNPYKIKKRSLRGFKIVEPITTYPASYSASNPLASDYYVPSAWFVYGQKVDATRLLTFCSRPVPDLLKPVYNFSGMSLSQLAQPYVDYWFGTRDSVGKLLRNFSTLALATDLDVLLSPSGDELIRRSQLFTKLRDNQSILLINKDSEALTQLNVPITGLDKLQAQAQEHMAAVAKTPLVILLGITPTGLNTTAEGDIRIYYDYIADQQERLFRNNLEIVIKMIMLDQLGYVDDDITFDFVSLFALTGKELAMVHKSDGDLAVELIQQGVISPKEVRSKLASDPESGFNNLDVDAMPTPLAATQPTMQTGGEQDSVTAEERSSTGDAAAQSALRIMRDANAFARDGGFRGNQFLGGFKDDDGPLSSAMRLSGAATAASRTARKLGTGRAHAAARSAHSRALEAHKRALSSAPSHLRPVHESYVDAHTAARDAHNSVLGVER